MRVLEKEQTLTLLVTVDEDRDDIDEAIMSFKPPEPEWVLDDIEYCGNYAYLYFYRKVHPCK